ncbi:MAG: ABC transporter substrate-binding protein [Desulfobacterales bacterium]|nr:ABC transporter substrate-binding protein [Desulfobacterales bacterium]
MINKKTKDCGRHLMSRLNLAVGAMLCILLLGAPADAGWTIIDDDGQTVPFSQPFTRIISLYGAHTENLFSLGLDAEIIGVTRSDDFPAQALDKPRFSYREDAEKFIAARPDLVLVRPMISRGYPQLLVKLKQAGITVVSLQPTNIKDAFVYWGKLGLLTGRQQRAAAMVRDFRAGLAEIRKKLSVIAEPDRKTVYFEAIHSKMKTFSPSSMTIFALTAAGGRNVAVDADQVRNTNIAAYGKERILSHAHGIDVFLAQQGVMNKITRRMIIKEPGFSVIKAVRENEVYLIDEKLVSRPTMRLLKGIRLIGGILYPELFRDD